MPVITTRFLGSVSRFGAATVEADAEIVKGSLLAGVLALLLGKAVDCRRGRPRVSSGEERRAVEWMACMAAKGRCGGVGVCDENNVMNGVVRRIVSGSEKQLICWL